VKRFTQIENMYVIERLGMNCMNWLPANRCIGIQSKLNALTIIKAEKRVVFHRNDYMVSLEALQESLRAEFNDLLRKN